MARTPAALSPAFHTTYSSWLNQVERWFGLITQHAIRRVAFKKVRELIGSIEQFVAHYSTTARHSLDRDERQYPGKGRTTC